MKHIAVLSGGGAKGLIQVSCLATLQSSGKKDFINGYDLFVGSSAGAINSCILALKSMTPKELLLAYPGMLDTIFHKELFHFVPIYQRNNFQTCWNNHIPILTKFGDCKVKCSISSVDACEDTTHFFKSWEKEDGNLLAMGVVEKSFAAPLYFGQINDYTNQKVWFDGGCGAYNLPIDFAYTEAELLGWIGSEEVVIEAYGTGYSDEPTPFNKASKQNFLDQLWQFMVPGDGGMARVQSRLDQVRKMAKIASTLKNIHFEYYDILIPKKLDQMDDLKHKFEYTEYGYRMAQKPLISV